MKKPGKARLPIRSRQLTVVSHIPKDARGGSSNQAATIVFWHFTVGQAKTPENLRGIMALSSEVIEVASWLCKCRYRLKLWLRQWPNGLDHWLLNWWDVRTIGIDDRVGWLCLWRWNFGQGMVLWTTERWPTEKGPHVLCNPFIISIKNGAEGRIRHIVNDNNMLLKYKWVYVSLNEF